MEFVKEELLIMRREVQYLFADLEMEKVQPLKEKTNLVDKNLSYIHCVQLPCFPNFPALEMKQHIGNFH